MTLPGPAATAATADAVTGPATGADRRPDVLIMLSDQQRPDTLGVYGQRFDTTPVLDDLARRGTVFDRAFCVNPVCGPARAAIQTGLRPTDVGCWRNGRALGEDVSTLADRLGALGYRTGYVGKWHLASDIGPGLGAGRTRTDLRHAPVPRRRRGGYTDAWVAADALELTSGAYRGHLWDEDDELVPLTGYRVDAVTDLAVDRLRRLAGDDRPFVLFVSYLEPHHQNDRMRTIGPRGEARRYRGFDVPGDLAGTLGDWRWNYAETLAACAAIDTGVGRLLDTLGALGRDRQTLTVYSSDHGSHFRTRNPEYKRSCHDASIRVPLIVSGPGFSAGRRDDRLVTHLDLVPTLLAAAGASTSPELAGRALHAPAADAPWRDEVFVQLSESQIGRALRTDRYTYAVAAPGWNPLRGHLRPAADTYVESHCYDLALDPHQRRNLAGRHESQALRTELARRLVDAIEAAEGARPRIVVR